MLTKHILLTYGFRLEEVGLNNIKDRPDTGYRKMFAVFKSGGKQHKAGAGDVIKIEKLAAAAGDVVTFDDVLLVGDGQSMNIGAPFVEGAAVTGEVIEQGRAKKIIIFKKRRRKNSRRKNGHRQYLTTVKITDILTGGAKPKAKPAVEKMPSEKASVPKAENANQAESTPLFEAPQGKADDLKKISGVGPVLEKKLNALGITQYAQIAAFSESDIERVDELLNFKGRIERDNWIDQAKALAED